MTKDDDGEYWDGVAQGSSEGVVDGLIRDVGECVLENLSGGMISRSDDSQRGIEDGRDGVHDDD